MSKETNIEWCDSTFNGWIGCTKVSPGCANCYAETLMDTRWGKVRWGKGKPRQRTSAANWKEPMKWNRYAEKWNMRPRVFCSSLSDWLDDEVPIEWLADLLALIHATPNLDWLMLTKRPENFKPRLLDAMAGNWADPADLTDRVHAWIDGTRIPSNVWIGTTVENQAMADKRIPQLLSIPAAVRFLSCEPLLSDISIVDNESGWPMVDSAGRHQIHWVICGGESGPNARQFHADWARSLRDQCASANVPFFMKQMGGTRKPFTEIPSDLNIKQFP